MRAVFIVLAVSFLAASGCGSSSASTASPLGSPAEVFAPPPPPSNPLPVKVPSLDFTPPSVGEALGAGLIAALTDMESIAIVLPNEPSSAALEEKVFSMVKAASPSTAVLARGRSTLDTLLEERGELPYRVTHEAVGADVLGRPVFVPKEHPLRTQWLANPKALRGAKALLVVRRARVDDQRLRQLRERRTGDCGPTLDGLRTDSSHAASYFAPYLEPINEALARAFSRHLSAAEPVLSEKLNSSTNPRCAKAYQELLRAYEPCAHGTCDLSPVAGAAEGGIVGLPEPEVFIPPTCPSADSVDMRDELQQVARRAVTEVLPSMDGPWTGELLRAAGQAAIADTLEGICAPRHRRIAPSDLQSARQAVGRFLKDLATEPLAGAWQTAQGQARLPGKGPLTLLARVQPTGSDPRTQAALIAGQFKKLDLCTGASANIYQVSLVEVGTSEVLFLGLFFEEQLLCPGLPPA